MKKTIFCLALLCLVQSSVRAADEEGAPLKPGPNMVLDGVPELPAALVQSLRRYQQARSAGFQDWLPDGSMLVTTRFADTAQVHRVYQPGGRREQLTFLTDRVAWARACPKKDCDFFLYGIDRGGDEFYQIYRKPLSGGQAVLLTDGKSRNGAAVWDRQGKLIAFHSTRRNGTDFDIYLMDPLRPESTRLLCEVEGTWDPLDFSPDGKTLLVRHYVSVQESHLWLVDTASGERRRLTPEQASPVSYPAARFSPDGRSVFLLSDGAGDFIQIFEQSFPAEKFEPMPVLKTAAMWDVEAFDLSPDGKLLAFSLNEGGISRLHIWDRKAKKLLPPFETEKGVLGALSFRKDKPQLAFDLRGPRVSGDVWSWAAGERAALRWTFSELGDLSPKDLSEPRLVEFPTFDEVGLQRRRIPAWMYTPSAVRFPPPWSVLVEFHGGPEGQARPTYLGSLNYLVNELGIALLAPNVRGSTGYGKTFSALDNGKLRENALRDVDALMEWIRAQPDLDASRAAVMGASYGGFMSLASMARYGERLRCGMSYVGISNFITFLENTQAYRRDLRRQEYGDERQMSMRMFLEMISPLGNAHMIKGKLLVLQGERDPRVPASEAEQIVTKAREKGNEVWYVLARDEGHGFVRKANNDFATAVMMHFFETCLSGEQARGKAP